MKKSFFYTLIVFCFVAFFLVFDTPEKGFAESVKDYEDKIEDLEKERKELEEKETEVEKNQSEVEGKMNKNLEDQDAAEEKLETIQEKVTNTEEKINNTEETIQVTKEKIDRLNDEMKELKKEIKELKKRIKKREKLLKDRLRTLQESGGNVPYISVLLGSKDFSELISRSSAVTSIMDQDESIVKEHMADKESLEKKKSSVADKKETIEEEKEEQEAQKSNLKELKSKLDDQKEEQEELKEELEDEYGEMEEYSMSLEDENKINDNRSDSLEKAKQQAQDEIGKIEEEKKKKKKQEAQENNQNNDTRGNNGGGGSGNSTADSGGGNGIFAWPTSGSLSSGFGSRTSPGGIGSTNHNGVDFSASKGTAVTAPASGVVNFVKSGCTEGDHSCGGGYGNYIIVTHYIGGKSYDTLYAHLSNANVTTGQSVSKGETIGSVGHTGSSTGPHLHFEVHPGGYKNPVNPMQYLP